MANLLAEQMCPHCGAIVRLAPSGLTTVHAIEGKALADGPCPGSGQIPRCALSDARPLWNGEPNPHFGG